MSYDEFIKQGGMKKVEMAMTYFKLPIPYTKSQVNAKFRKLMKLHHPDAGGKNEEIAKIITSAKKFLISAIPYLSNNYGERRSSDEDNVSGPKRRSPQTTTRIVKHLRIKVTMKQIVESSTIKFEVDNRIFQISIPNSVRCRPIYINGYDITFELTDKRYGTFEWLGEVKSHDSRLVITKSDQIIEMTSSIERILDNSGNNNYDYITFVGVKTPYGIVEASPIAIDSVEKLILFTGLGFLHESIFIPNQVERSFLVCEYKLI